MNYSEFDNYYKECKEKGLTKIDLTIEEDPDIDASYVTKTKETYIFWCDDADEDSRVEKQADDLIDSVRLMIGFKEAKKDFKKGRENKAGEVLKCGSYVVVIKREH